MSDTFSLIKQAQSGDKAALDIIVRENMGLVKSIAVRFLSRGCEFDDLCQIGTIGMIKAVRGFDFSHGTMFSTYAVPLIMGEIKKFLRDDGLIKVSRELKHRGILLMRAKDSFITENGREPTVSELASAASLSVEETAEALTAVCPVMSLCDPVGEMQLEDLIGTDHIDALTESIALRQAIAKLPEEDKKLIKLRFFDNISQAAAGKLLGMTQVRVSRREKKILQTLREALE